MHIFQRSQKINFNRSRLASKAKLYLTSSNLYKQNNLWKNIEKYIFFVQAQKILCIYVSPINKNQCSEPVFESSVRSTDLLLIQRGSWLWLRLHIGCFCSWTSWCIPPLPRKSPNCFSPASSPVHLRFRTPQEALHDPIGSNCIRAHRIYLRNSRNSLLFIMFPLYIKKYILPAKRRKKYKNLLQIKPQLSTSSNQPWS